MSSFSRSAQGGFTLIELLVVIAIIGILAAAAVPQILDAICNSRGTSAQSEIATIRTAVVQCQTESGCNTTSLSNMENRDIVAKSVANKYEVNETVGNDPVYQTGSTNVIGCTWENNELKGNVGDSLRYYSGNGEFELFNG